MDYKISEELKQFVQAITKYGDVTRDMNGDREANAIFGALHSALDSIGVPRGEERHKLFE